MRRADSSHRASVETIVDAALARPAAAAAARLIYQAAICRALL